MQKKEIPVWISLLSSFAEREGFVIGPKGRFHKATRLKEP